MSVGYDWVGFGVGLSEGKENLVFYYWCGLILVELVWLWWLWVCDVWVVL